MRQHSSRLASAYPMIDAHSRVSLVAGWEQLPESKAHLDVSDVAVDSRDRVFALGRRTAEVFVFEPSGAFITSWGADVLSSRPHGITIGLSDTIYCTDQYGNAVWRFSWDGKPQGTVGPRGIASETGVDWSLDDFFSQVASIRRGGPPFNQPTSAAVSADGDVYVADGYGNARIHLFSSEGELIRSWGQPGGAPGEFRVPHDIAIAPDGRVLVVDRENERIQVFTRLGKYVEEWTSVQRPSSIAIDRQGRVYVAELAWHRGQRSWTRGWITSELPPRLTVLDLNGDVVTRFDAAEFNRSEARMLTTPHGIAVDSAGAVYIAQVSDPAVEVDGPPRRDALQKWELEAAGQASPPT